MRFMIPGIAICVVYYILVLITINGDGGASVPSIIPGEGYKSSHVVIELYYRVLYLILIV